MGIYLGFFLIGFAIALVLHENIMDAYKYVLSLIRKISCK